MIERWRNVEDFYGIDVSDHGNVRNAITGRHLSQSLNVRGVPKVNILIDGKHYSRSVRELVAGAFLEPPNEELSYQRQYDKYISPIPINLNGDVLDNNYKNLAWRPRWFAWKYTRQFNEERPYDYFIPLINLRTGERFETTMEAGIAEGLLWEYVISSVATGREVYPTASVFDFWANQL